MIYIAFIALSAIVLVSVVLIIGNEKNNVDFDKKRNSDGLHEGIKPHVKTYYPGEKKEVKKEEFVDQNLRNLMKKHRGEEVEEEISDKEEILTNYEDNYEEDYNYEDVESIRDVEPDPKIVSSDWVSQNIKNINKIIYLLNENSYILISAEALPGWESSWDAIANEIIDIYQTAYERSVSYKASTSGIMLTLTE